MLYGARSGARFDASLLATKVRESLTSISTRHVSNKPRAAAGVGDSPTPDLIGRCVSAGSVVLRLFNICERS